MPERRGGRGGFEGGQLSAPQRCNAQRSDAQRKFFTTLSISLFLQRHRCDALPCFSASPVEIFYIAHIALRPLLPFFLSPQWFTVQNNKKFAKSHNAAMSPLATRDGQRNAQRATQRCGALRWATAGLCLMNPSHFFARTSCRNFGGNFGGSSLWERGSGGRTNRNRTHQHNTKSASRTKGL